MDKAYYASERFIHDELLTRCAPLVNKIKEMWRKDKQIYPQLLLWPSGTVRATDGSKFSGVVFSELAGDEPTRKTTVHDAVRSCDAFAVLVTEQLEDAVRLIFESPHGTRTWRIPIKKHGDVQVLGQATVRDNAESVGVLWTAN